MANYRKIIRQLIKETIQEDNEYQDLVQKVMNIIGIDSPQDLDDDGRAKFFSYLDSIWNPEDGEQRRDPDPVELKRMFGESIVTERKGSDVSILIDTLVNSMEHFEDPNEFVDHIASQTKYKPNQLKKIFDKYWKVGARDRFSWDTAEWTNWLSQFGINESVNESEIPIEKVKVGQTVTNPTGGKKRTDPPIFKVDKIEKRKGSRGEEIVLHGKDRFGKKQALIRDKGKPVRIEESINESKPHGPKIEALNDFFNGKISAEELKKMADDVFGRPIATKKQLDDFVNNKFLQGVMADAYDIAPAQLERKVKELLKLRVYEGTLMESSGNWSIVYYDSTDPFAGDVIRKFQEFDKNKIAGIFKAAVDKFLKNEGDTVEFVRGLNDVILAVELRNGKPMTQVTKGSKTYYRPFRGFK